MANAPQSTLRAALPRRRSCTTWQEAGPITVTVYFVPVGCTPVTPAEPCADPLAASDRVCRVRGGRRAGARAPRSIPVTRAVVRSLASARSEPFVAGSRPTPRAVKYRYLVNCHRNPARFPRERRNERSAGTGGFPDSLFRGDDEQGGVPHANFRNEVLRHEDFLPAPSSSLCSKNQELCTTSSAGFPSDFCSRRPLRSCPCT